MHRFHPGGDYTFFLDGYAAIEPGALLALVHAHRVQPEALAASGIQRYGTFCTSRYGLADGKGRTMWQPLHAAMMLSRLRQVRFRLPVGIYRLYPTLAAALFLDLDPSVRMESQPHRHDPSGEFHLSDSAILALERHSHVRATTNTSGWRPLKTALSAITSAIGVGQLRNCRRLHSNSSPNGSPAIRRRHPASFCVRRSPGSPTRVGAPFACPRNRRSRPSLSMPQGSTRDRSRDSQSMQRRCKTGELTRQMVSPLGAARRPANARHTHRFSPNVASRVRRRQLCSQI